MTKIKTYQSKATLLKSIDVDDDNSGFWIWYFTDNELGRLNFHSRSAAELAVKAINTRIRIHADFVSAYP